MHTDFDSRRYRRRPDSLTSPPIRVAGVLLVLLAAAALIAPAPAARSTVELTASARLTSRTAPGAATYAAPITGLRGADGNAADLRMQPANEGSGAGDAGVSPPAREIVVGPDRDIRSISAAVKQAEAGDRIIVLAGVYREGTILIDRRIELVGRGSPELDAQGEGQLLRVTADSVVIRGLTLSNAGVSYVHDHSAILFDGVTGCVAEDNRLIDNYFGIYLARSSDCRIAGNVITASGERESSSGNGIHMWSSDRIRVENNQIRGQRDGIYLEHVRGAAMRGNVSENNLRYGLHFMFSNENEYVANTFRNNGAGVAVMYSKDVLIRDNTFEDNWGPTAYGLLAKEISDSRITGNRFVGNTVAFSSEGSIRVHVANNRFMRNGWAARVMANSQDNDFVDNDFIDNAFDVSTNSRRNYNTFAGNYWSRYTGYDLDGDGVGDVPFRPVRLFSLLVERTPLALVLLRSAFVDLLDVAERVAPILTPETLVDLRPSMREVQP